MGGYTLFPQSTYTCCDTVKREVDCKVPLASSNPVKCKVLRIQETDQVYAIDIEIVDNTIRSLKPIYTILSLKNGPHVTDIKEEKDFFSYNVILFKSEKHNLKKIKRGKTYAFRLFAYFDKIIVGDPIYMLYTINGISFGFKGDFKTGQIVTTPNLQGLYYNEH